ncbi:RNA 2',3'-cyclic phosphodiesterase [Oryzomonas sagensis]|uniref:RNA 2',3'-cyclic phosphodiesterase n=1 Tax=Oryzomonas sagensis TaxID=2603857 RepID=A0ABQ6TMG6_9BACT|nr:RNA 2',3'-cyclic phosphodiesterase [Oryzomonas sagensis]KAB0669657.1 RNA 2',3'-cyclic phosphodiesterase [Oryzomonas sagensis]
MRLFIAIELPGEIKRQLEGMGTGIPGGRWVPADQLHLTLAFLGEVDDGTLRQLTGALARIRVPGFTLRFNGTGCFPDLRRPRVLWAGLEPEPKLDDLASLVREAAVACAIAQEERPFFSHITLARLKLPAPREVEAFLTRHRTLELPPIDVREFLLFQSRLTPQGAIHTPVQGFALWADAASSGALEEN